MNISLSSSPFSGLSSDNVLAVLCTKDTLSRDPAFSELDSAHGGVIKKTVEEEGFSAKWKKIHILRLSEPGPRLVFLIGLDDSKLPYNQLLRQAGAIAADSGNSYGVKRLHIAILGELENNTSLRTATRLLAEGALLSAQKRFSLKSKQGNDKEIEEVVFMWPGQDTLVLEEAVRRARIISRGVGVARDLVNEPAGTLTPPALADRVAQLADDTLTVTIHGVDWLREKGMSGILGVGAGSSSEPRLIEAVYDPGDTKNKELLLVGKGITFDSGGLSLKPRDSMATMKCDMAGAASVAGLAAIISDLEPGRRVRMLLAAAENMPDGSAIKIGDVLHMYGGKTVEVLNTDAEGRLVLADALSYGTEFDPEAVIDLATLTGASVVALGKSSAAVMGTSSELIRDVLSASDHAGECIWELPLIEHYRTMLESKIADLKNIGDRWGGAITAGLFLSEFTRDKPWAHIDIAGPAWMDKAQPAFPEGGTGFGVATLIEMLSPFAG